MFDIEKIEDPELKASFKQYLETHEEDTKKKFQGDIDRLTQTNTDLKSEKKKAAERAAALQGVIGDRDPEKVAELLKKLESDEDAALLANGDVEGYRARLSERFEADSKAKLQAEAEKLTAATQQVESLSSQVHDLTIGAAINQAFISHGGLKDEHSMKYANLEAKAYWNIVDGKKECRDPATGELMTTGEGLMSEAQWVQDVLRVKVPSLFEKVKGSGASGAGGAGGKSYKDMNQEERIAYISEHGPEAALNQT